MPKSLGELAAAPHGSARRLDVSQGQPKSSVDAQRAGESDRVVAALGDVQRSLRLGGEADDMLGRGRVTGRHRDLESDRVVVGGSGGRHRSVGVVAALLPTLGIGLVDQSRQHPGPAGVVVRAEGLEGVVQHVEQDGVAWLRGVLVGHPGQGARDEELGVAGLVGQGGGLAQRLDPLRVVVRQVRPGELQQHFHPGRPVVAGRVPLEELEHLEVEAGGIGRRERRHGRGSSLSGVGDGLGRIGRLDRRLPVPGQLRELCRVERGARGGGFENLGDAQVGALAPRRAELAVEGVLDQCMGEAVALGPVRLLQERGGGGRLDDVEHVIGVGSRHCAEHVEVEGASDDRRRGQGAMHVGA